MKMSPMVRDFCNADIYTDLFSIYRGANNSVTLTSSEEYMKYIKSNYVARNFSLIKYNRFCDPIYFLGDLFFKMMKVYVVFREALI
jgi:hypothetical protein